MSAQSVGPISATRAQSFDHTSPATCQVMFLLNCTTPTRLAFTLRTNKVRTRSLLLEWTHPSRWCAAPSPGMTPNARSGPRVRCARKLRSGLHMHQGRANPCHSVRPEPLADVGHLLGWVAARRPSACGPGSSSDAFFRRWLTVSTLFAAFKMVKSSDIILVLVAILFPPAAVGILTGCSCDLLINMSAAVPPTSTLSMPPLTLPCPFAPPAC